MATLQITHHTKKECITFSYTNNHEYTIYGVKEGSEIVTMFELIRYAFEHEYKIEMNKEN